MEVGFWQDQALISELHWCSLLQLLLPQNMLEQVVLPTLGLSSLSCSVDTICERRGEVSCVSSSSPVSKDRQGPSLQVQRGIVTEGNGLQVTGHKRSEDTETTRFFLKSGVQVGDWVSGSHWWSMHGVQRPRDIWSLISLAEDPGNLANDVIPCLQRGQGIDPGGPTVSEEMLLVEQRYKAHLTHSPWPHPEIRSPSQ